MPLGRSKQYLRGLTGVAGRAFAIRSPSVILPSTSFQIAWLLQRPSALPGTEQVIERCGDGSTTGWQLVYQTDGAFRFSTFSAGPTTASVTTPQNVGSADDLDKFFVLRATLTNNNLLAVGLNDHDPTTGAGSMAAPTTADRVLLAADTAGTSALLGLVAVQAALGAGFNQATDAPALLTTTQVAQRLVEPAECVSYVDFGRFRSLGLSTTTQGHFGDDATGARVELTGSGALPILRQYRSDRVTDWSTT